VPGAKLFQLAPLAFLGWLTGDLGHHIGHIQWSDERT
jgi:hypothetical protein